MSLSCEIPSDMPCKHGVKLPNLCSLCIFYDRLEILDSQMKSLTEMYKNLSINTDEFHVHKSCQIDENRKISRRVDELENNYIKNNKQPYKCPVCLGIGDISESPGFLCECEA